MCKRMMDFFVLVCRALRKMIANRLKNCNKTRQRGTAEASWFKGAGEIWLQLMRAKGRQETEWWSPNTAVSSGSLAGGGAADEWDTSSLTAAPQTVMERHNITTTDGEIDGHARLHEKDKRNLERRIALIYETAGRWFYEACPATTLIVKQSDRTAIHLKNRQSWVDQTLWLERRRKSSYIKKN